MAATPKGGVLLFRGLSSGTTYSKAIYNQDVNGALARFDNGAGTPAAASDGSDFITFDEPTVLYDASVVTGIADTTQLRVMANYNPTAFNINWAAHVNSLAYRPNLNIGFKAGTRISVQSLK
jgi:hypothetical protein